MAEWGKRWAALLLLCPLGLFGAGFKLYPGAVPTPVPESKDQSSKAGAVSYATADDFAKVANFYRALGTEQAKPEGTGDGTARAIFQFDDGITLMIRRARPMGDPTQSMTFLIDLSGKMTKPPGSKPEISKPVPSKTETAAKNKK